MPERRRQSTPAAYWFFVGAAFELAGAIVILTSTLLWLAVVAFVAGAACLVLGTVASRRR